MKFLRLLLLLSILAPYGNLAANEWPTWRGPNGDGKLPDDAKYPTEWSATENLLWRVDLPDRGNSSPIVLGKRLFLTQAEEDGKLRSLLCLDVADGKLLWKKTIDHGKAEQTHKTNPHCAASPVTDGERVYAWHGNAGLFAYDLDGNEAWQRNLGSDYDHIWGPNAASPVIHGDNLIVHAGPGTAVGLFGLHRETGEILWTSPIADTASESAKQFKGSWATPWIIDNDGREEMLIGVPGSLRSFDPATGKEWWRCGGLGDLCYTNVITGAGNAAYLCGYGGPGIGVRLPDPDQTGDLTESHRLWADPPKGKNRNAQRIGSGQIIGDHLFLLNATGAIQCLDVKTGASRWSERLSKASWSSMNLVGGKLYVNDKSGTTFILALNPDSPELLATNRVDPGQSTNASLAFAGGKIYLRTDAHLYAIGE